MAKHSESFKLEVVQRYVAGARGVKALAKEFGIGRTSVASWVARYREHGVEGLRKKIAAYDVKFKLNVLQQASRRELSDRQAATLFDLRGGGGVVARWRREYDQGGAQALRPKSRGRSAKKMPKPKPPPIETPHQDDTRSVEILRKENEALRAEVAYLKKLEALVRATRQAAPKGRKPCSN
jgi:transposase